MQDITIASVIFVVHLAWPSVLGYCLFLHASIPTPVGQALAAPVRFRQADEAQ
jgi:hypothetical protein